MPLSRLCGKDLWVGQASCLSCSISSFAVQEAQAKLPVLPHLLLAPLH
jgi:hypothetical protein